MGGRETVRERILSKFHSQHGTQRGVLISGLWDHDPSWCLSDWATQVSLHPVTLSLQSPVISPSLYFSWHWYFWRAQVSYFADCSFTQVVWRFLVTRFRLRRQGWTVRVMPGSPTILAGACAVDSSHCCNVNLGHLIKVVSATFVHCKVTGLPFIIKKSLRRNIPWYPSYDSVPCPHEQSSLKTV